MGHVPQLDKWGCGRNALWRRGLRAMWARKSKVSMPARMGAVAEHELRCASVSEVRLRSTRKMREHFPSWHQDAVWERIDVMSIKAQPSARRPARPAYRPPIRPPIRLAVPPPARPTVLPGPRLRTRRAPHNVERRAEKRKAGPTSARAQPSSGSKPIRRHLLETGDASSIVPPRRAVALFAKAWADTLPTASSPPSLPSVLSPPDRPIAQLPGRSTA